MKGKSTIRIVGPVAAAPGAMGAVASAGGASLFHTEATLENAFTHPNGQPGHLQLNFTSGPGGQVGDATMSIAGATASSPGFCAPICVTYGNPKRTRCFYPTGCGPNPHPLPTLDVPMAVEFDSKAVGKNSREMNIKLYRHGEKAAAAKSSGVLKFAGGTGTPAKASKASGKAAKASGKVVKASGKGAK